MKRTASRNKGFTIVEVLVAVGIMGIVSLGIAEMFRQMAEQQRNVVQLMNKQDLKNSILVAIRDKDGCTNTLLNRPIPTNPNAPVSIPNGIKNNAPSPVGGALIVQNGQNFGAAAGDWLTITNIQLVSQGPNIVGSLKNAKVRVSYSRVKGRGPVTENIEIDVKVIPKAGGLVDTCWTDFTDATICTANGGTYNPATGACQYTKLCAGNYCLKDVPGDPENGLCGPTGCTTNFSPQRCPRPGQNSNFTMVIGIEKGTVICGPYNGL